MSQIPAASFVWKDGEFLAWEDATVHVLAHSVQFGASLFEGIRCYATEAGPAIFRWDAHLRRLYDSCRIYRTEIGYSPEEMTSAAREVIRRNGLEECYLKPMVVRGYGAIGMVHTASPVEVYLFCWPWGEYLGEGALENGVDVCVSSWHRPHPNTTPAMAKVAGNYLNSQLAKMEALENGFVEAIQLGTDGMISEGTGQNLFLVRDDVIHTTPLANILPGITRDSVLTLARDMGMQVAERPIPRELLYLADEIFFTGTATEVTPIRSVDRVEIGSGSRGPITEKLQRRFLDVVRGREEDRWGWLTRV